MRYVKYVTVLILVFFLAGCCGNLEVTIISPQDGNAFNVGEAITFSGTASFGAQPIADEILVWKSLPIVEEITMFAFDRITFDPQVMGGRACIRGMRVTVALILNLVANGMTAQQILAEYPYLEEEDIRQALQYAAWLADESVQVIEPV